MPREFSRARRIAEQMQKEIALLLQREFKDPRVGLATVSGVELSGDLMYAKVFVSFLDLEDQKIAEAVRILNRASGFFRSMVGSRMKRRAVPAITFHDDPTLGRGRELSDLIDRSVARDRDLQRASGEEP